MTKIEASRDWIQDIKRLLKLAALPLTADEWEKAAILAEQIREYFLNLADSARAREKIDGLEAARADANRIARGI